MMLALVFSFALNVLLIAAFIYQAIQSGRERQSLALLIKSRDVQEFVRAETQLAVPPQPEKEPPPPPLDLSQVDPNDVADTLEGRTTRS